MGSVVGSSLVCVLLSPGSSVCPTKAGQCFPSSNLRMLRNFPRPLQLLGATRAKICEVMEGLGLGASRGTGGGVGNSPLVWPHPDCGQQLPILGGSMEKKLDWPRKQENGKGL